MITTHVKFPMVEIAERDWWVVWLIGPPLHALLGAATWWIWTWGFHIQDAPTWSFYFAAFVGVLQAPGHLFLRKP